MTNWEEIGKVWVDSGQILIADPCYALSKDDYTKLVLIRPYEKQPHELKRGVINSGWGGDGNFPVFVKKNSQGLVMEMKIVFHVPVEKADE